MNKEKAGNSFSSGCGGIPGSTLARLLDTFILIFLMQNYENLL